MSEQRRTQAGAPFGVASNLFGVKNFSNVVVMFGLEMILCLKLCAVALKATEQLVFPEAVRLN